MAFILRAFYPRFSLINQNFITVGTFCGVWTECALHYQIYFPARQLLQIHQHSSMRKEGERLGGIVGNKKVFYIAPRCFPTSKHKKTFFLRLFNGN